MEKNRYGIPYLKHHLSLNTQSVFVISLSLFISSALIAEETVITHEYSYEVTDPVVVQSQSNDVVTTESSEVVPMIVETETIVTEGEGNADPVVVRKRTTEVIEQPIIETETVQITEPTTTIVQEQSVAQQEPVVTTTEVTQVNPTTGETVTTTTVREEREHIQSIKIDPASVDIQVVGLQTVEGGSVCGSEPLTGTVTRVTNNGTTNSFTQTGKTYSLCVTGNHNELNLGRANNLETIYITGNENLINVAPDSSVGRILFMGDKNMVFLSTGINPQVEKKGAGNKVVKPEQRR